MLANRLLAGERDLGLDRRPDPRSDRRAAALAGRVRRTAEAISDEFTSTRTSPATTAVTPRLIPSYRTTAEAL